MISLIVVDYNSIIKTCDYIEHFYSKIIDKKNSFSYIIIDNYKFDSVEFLKNRYSYSHISTLDNYNVYFFNSNFGQLCYCFSNENLGYAKGNNLGTRIANYYYHSDYYIISNNDLKINSDVDFSVFENIFNSDPKIAVIGPQVIGLDGKKQSPYKRKSSFYLLIVYQWSRFWPIRSKGDLVNRDESCVCYRIMGCFMVIKSSVFNLISGFDPNTFLYGEEIILSEKLRQNNYYCYYFDDFSIIHEHGVTIKKMSSTIQNDKWLYSSLYYCCKEYYHASHFLCFLSKINRFLNLLCVYFKCAIRKLFKG